MSKKSMRARDYFAAGLLFIALGVAFGILTPITYLGFLIPYPPYAWPATIFLTVGLLLSLTAIHFIENMKNKNLLAVGFTLFIIGIIVGFQNPTMGYIRYFAWYPYVWYGTAICVIGLLLLSLAIYFNKHLK